MKINKTTSLKTQLLKVTCIFSIITNIFHCQNEYTYQQNRLNEF